MEKLSYKELTHDNLTGLYISNNPESLPIVADNIPPLILDEHMNDHLLVYKNYKNGENDNEYNVDLTEKIDIIQLSDKNDIATLENSTNTLIDFGGGEDKAIIVAADIESKIDMILNFESLTWIKTKQYRGNENIDEENEEYNFEVIKAIEDESKSYYLDPLLNELDGDGLWVIKRFGEIEETLSSDLWLTQYRFQLNQRISHKGK